MVMIHTVYEAGAWRTKVDGLQQGTSYDDQACAVSAARVIAAELGGTLVVHDTDGHELERTTHTGRPTDVDLGPLRYTA